MGNSLRKNPDFFTGFARESGSLEICPDKFLVSI